MSEGFFSDQWHRVADLKARLASHVTVYRHRYRGRVTFILRNAVSGSGHKLTPAGYTFVGLLDGSRTVDDAWQLCMDRLGDDAPTQREIVTLLVQMNGSDLLAADVAADVEAIQDRARRIRRSERMKRYANPMALRFSLLDPDRFLATWLPAVRWLFGPAGLVLWLTFVAAGIYTAAVHWNELTGNLADRVLAPGNLLLLWLVFPLIKAIHELGHGFAIKRWGGEVHEMGIMLLVLTPVPYVDAAASSVFRSKARRAVVGAAGILVEVFLAALAVMLWAVMEPGLMRSLMFNVALIGSVSTVLFNGNPLLKFDGYYILSDLIEMPNLATRANRYLLDICRRLVLRTDEAPRDHGDSRERAWLMFYGIASFIYRMFVAFAIILFVASKFFVIGLLLAAWAFVVMILMPLGKLVRYLAVDPRLSRGRSRYVRRAAVAAAILGAFVFAVPVPFMTVSEGVVWVPESSQVRAGAEGFVDDLLVPTGTIVRPGDPLIGMSDPILLKERAVIEARLAEAEARRNDERTRDLVEAQRIEDEIVAIRAELGDVDQRIGSLLLRAPDEGRFVVPDHDRLRSRFLRRGERAAYVLTDDPPVIRAVVNQEDVDLVRNRLEAVELRVGDRLAVELEADLLREVPGAIDTLPSAALSTEGGGPVALDPTDPSGLRAYQPIFQFDIAPRATGAVDLYGTRVYVRFRHGRAPIGYQLYRKFRQQFLRLIYG